MASAYQRYFSNVPKLKELSLSYLQSLPSKSDSFANINKAVSEKLGLQADVIAEAINDEWIKSQLAKARRKMKEENLIGYNVQKKVWYVAKSKRKGMSLQEEKFIERRVGSGWKKIKDPLIAIDWLHKNLSPDEFENFCIAILSSHCKVDMKITKKRRYSGADEGFDGIGTYLIDGINEPIALQAKRYNLTGQVSQDQCQKFIGALFEKQMKYGFIITTGIFSERAKSTLEKVKEQGIWIEPIDQVWLANIMLEKSDLPHGFGLYQTDIGWHYMNEDILRKAAQGI